MMSKERELLRECYFFIDNNIDASPKALLIRIAALLAQSEQEPVAWLITATSCGGAQDWKFVSLERKAPEKLERMFPKFTPLYTTPPKREPFGPEERERLSRAYSTKAEQVAFEEGIIFAEISYSIGGEE